MLEKPWKILNSTDPEIYSLIEKELQRQREGLELIASENFASYSVISTMGSILTNKYAEGLPSKRYYGGCKFVDEIENIAISRACELFGARFANVQPHSGAQANAAVYMALCSPGDKVLGMNLSSGGHLTHGSKVNFSGSLYQSFGYNLDPETETIDYDDVEKKAQEIRPRMIIAGASAYPRIIDFKRFREIADSVGAYLMVDMAHIAGLVAAGLHPSPVPYAHVVTTTTHKTLRGPRGGLILWNDENLKINKAVFPGIQGGPLEHIIASKAVCFKEAMSPTFKKYQQNILDNTRALAKGLLDRGYHLVSGGTDNHLLLMDLSSLDITGKDLEEALLKVCITVNKNTVPKETRSPMITSGVRLGTAALSSRGMGIAEMDLIAGFIDKVIKGINSEHILSGIKEEVLSLCKKFPLYSEWE